MIKTFGDKETSKIFDGQISRRLPYEIQRKALMKLLLIHAAHELDDLKIPPGNRLERLKGTWSDYHSIRINSQWRIVFIWSSGNADAVRIVDYH